MNAPLSALMPPFAFNNALIVVMPVTPNVPPTVALLVTVALSNVLVPFAFNAPVNVVALVTANVPAIAVLPLALATVNLDVLTSKSPSIPAAPETANVVPIVAAPVIVALANVEAPAFSVLDNVVAPDTPSVPPTEVLPLDWVIVVAPTVNVVPSNVKFPSSSISPAAPAITTRLLVKSLILALDNVAAREVNVLVTANVPDTVSFPVTANTEPLNVKFPLSSTSPLAPAINTRLSVKSVTRKLPTAIPLKLPVITDEVSVASEIITNSEALSS